ncbi:hypothetical protein [Flavobacterium sp.]|jgi:hypothetical protein|uniref:hypothetical protein n=1 Tax=Flavobacterium sp. TaxID=239 RepID=UPI0037C06CED
MRKLLLAVTALLSFTLAASAQQSSKKAAKPATETKAPLKKDGTPDKRFKENKKAKVPLKKDGTPDKRFKENKK